MAEREDFISVESIYGAKDHQPAVIFKWNKEAGALTVNEARKHALRILEVAEGAESDSLIADWMRDKVAGDGRLKPEEIDHAIVITLRDFRRARALRSEKEGGV